MWPTDMAETSSLLFSTSSSRTASGPSNSPTATVWLMVNTSRNVSEKLFGNAESLFDGIYDVFERYLGLDQILVGAERFAALAVRLLAESGHHNDFSVFGFGCRA